MLALQYDLFKENTETCLLKSELEEIKKSTENVRRGLFARHNDLMKMLIKQQEEIDQLRSLIEKKG